jgi:rSAM/selenodomain-associated transferase 2
VISTWRGSISAACNIALKVCSQRRRGRGGESNVRRCFNRVMTEFFIQLGSYGKCRCSVVHVLMTKGEATDGSFWITAARKHPDYIRRTRPAANRDRQTAPSSRGRTLTDSQSISVIIPVLNEESQIAGTLASTLAALKTEARDRKVELIVADGGSRDRTTEIAAGFDSVRVIACRQANRGWQMNQGAQSATGDILLFLHADVILPEGALAAITQALTDERVRGGCFQIRFPAPAPASLRLVARGINFRTRLFRTATGDQAIFVRRGIFEEIGGFQILPLMEDIALFNEMKRRGRVAVLDGQVEISPRRWLKHGVWRTVLLMYLLRSGYWLGIHPATLKRFFLDVR